MNWHVSLTLVDGRRKDLTAPLPSSWWLAEWSEVVGQISKWGRHPIISLVSERGDVIAPASFDDPVVWMRVHRSGDPSEVLQPSLAAAFRFAEGASPAQAACMGGH